jgi:transposase
MSSRATEEGSGGLHGRPKRRCNESKNDESDNPATPKKKLKTVGPQEMDEIDKYVKTLRPNVVSIAEKLDILMLQGKIRFEHNERKKILSPGRKVANASATMRVASLLGRKKNLVAQVWSDYVNGIPFAVAQVKGNYRLKSTRVPRSRLLTSLVQRFVRERREIRQRTVAKDVMDFLDGLGFITVDRKSKKDVNAALRSVQRYLLALGYKRGKKKGMQNYRLREENIRKRDEYVQLMTAVNQDPARRVVYMDESYIHKNYQRNDDSLFDPNDEQDMEVKAMHKGRRYCFIAAIIDEDQTLSNVAEQEKPEAAKAHLLLDTLDIFEGGKQTVDYHGMFVTEYFVGWMKKLLDVLSLLDIHNAVIVMDNAKYHKTLPDGTPKCSWSKQNLLDYCRLKNITIGEGDLKTVLWGRVKDFVKQNVKPIIVSMAEDAGHTVVWSPPHHSDLQPIELVWANVKGTVGRQYTTQTTFQDVKNRLERAFIELQSKTVAGCIRKANYHLKELLDHILAMENTADESDDDESDSSDEEGSVVDV